MPPAKKIVPKAASRAPASIKGLPKVDIKAASSKIKKKKLWQYQTAIYGIKGIGKTTLCASFPKFLGIQLEPQRDELTEDVYQVPIDPVSLEELFNGQHVLEDGEWVLNRVEYSPWEQLKAYLMEAAADPEINGVFIDTIDFAYNYCYDHVCWKANVQSAKDIGYGDGWKIIAQEFTSVFNKFNAMGKGIVFISHCKEKEGGEVTVDKKGAVEMVDIFTLSCGSQPFAYVQKSCQYVFFYGMSKGKRTLFTRRPKDGAGGILLSCGGLDKFHYNDGSLIYSLDMTEVGPTEGYELLEAGFNNELDPPKEEESPFKKLPAKKVVPVKKTK